MEPDDPLARLLLRIRAIDRRVRTQLRDKRLSAPKRLWLARQHDDWRKVMYDALAAIEEASATVQVSRPKRS